MPYGILKQMVMKYLDPKADLTFKKIFGNHPKRLISLLNALMPLSEEEQIHAIKYLPTELVPQLEGGKNTIVDVLCTDVRGRKFCVEMQMEWSDAFQQRVLFNASKLNLYWHSWLIQALQPLIPLEARLRFRFL